MAKANSLPKGRPPEAERANHAENSGTRRTEILQTAASLIASSGLRTSLQEIADAAGILPGSLYHHFESKEAILVELIRRYQDDLDRIGRTAQAKLDAPDARPVPEKIIELGSAIARCAVQHGAALQMSFYEGPSSDPELIELTRRQPVAIQEAMLQALRAGRWSGYIKPDIDLPVLADRICQTMLQVGLAVMRHDSSPDQVASLLCRIILQGLATRSPADAALDRSQAFAAANEVIDTWADDSDADPSDKAAHVRAVARTVFGRKGYEVTTIRDIAAAADMGTGTVYRVIGSKDELLASIMKSFGKKVEAGWVKVLRSDATAVEKLDALSWVNVNALDRFSDEFRIQLAWMRQSPPDSPNPGWLYATRLRQMKSLLSEGIKSGEIAIQAPSTAMLARCVVGLQWIPENILRNIGTRAALLHARDTVLRGVAVRSG
ncbi:TetR/AcrR family transcriptional regulator [Mycobacterium servetii]|uniref:TetR/AcrR family transcriptional regulator n=1 Tax=Mycobacterium servetii TaxID=3237418 RepID=A0ABV4BXG3_9MYCO